MANNANAVFNAIMAFAAGNSRNRVFIDPDIPTKKLVNARSKYITRDEPIIVLVDDTLFGSAKDGLAISENYVYAKGTLGDIKSVKLSSIRSVSSQSNKLGSLDIYFGGNLFVTLSTIDKEDHDFVIGVLKAAYAASKSVENSAPAKIKKPSKPVAAEPKPKNSNLGKETVACSECSANLPVGAKFCLECGTKVIPRGVCLTCNAKLPEKAKFCSECGASATNASGAKTKNVQASTLSPTSKVTELYASAFHAFSNIHDPSIDSPRRGRFPALNRWADEEIEHFIDSIIDNSTIASNAGQQFYRVGHEEEFGEGWVKLKCIETKILNKAENSRFNVDYDITKRQLLVFEVIFDSGDYDPSQPCLLFYVHDLETFEDTGEYFAFWYQSNQSSCNPKDSECFEEMMQDVRPLTGVSVPKEIENEENMMKNDVINDRKKLAKLASGLEEKFISNGRIAAFFENCENLYIKIYLDLDPEGGTLLYEVTVETDGNCEDEGDTQEDILDYISDNGLFDGLEEIFGDRNVTDDTVWNVHIRPLSTDPTERAVTEVTVSGSIEALNKDETVQIDLSHVEDTLLEKGTLESLLGGGDPEVSIKFEHINPYDMDSAANFMVINITEDDFDTDNVDDDDAEEFGDNVHQKVSEFASDWESSLRETFEGLEGVVVRINGQYCG
jgi:ribosomal protein L40E